MKRALLFIALVSVMVPVFAQQGSPILSNFGKSRDIENQNWAICQDDCNVMLFANRKGILTFDGEEYQNVRIPVIPYAMQKDPSSGRIFIGGDNTFGYLSRDETGEYRYYPLPSDSLPTGIATRILFDDKKAWFYGEQSIIRYDLETGQRTLRLDSKPGNLFSGMMVTSKNTFINVTGKGLYRIEGDTLFPIVTGYLTEKSEILFSLPYNSTYSLVGLSDGTLSLFDGIKYIPFQLNDNGYLRNSLLSDGIALSDTAYAFSTLDGGAEVVGKLSGKVIFLINNQCELPDDEIFAIGSDNNGGLWLSHQFGLTRVDLNLPVRNYSVFSGMKGNLASFARFGNELYTATSEGIYYLTQVANYTGVEVFLKSENTLPARTETAVEQEQTKPNSRRGIFAKIFGKKNIPQETEVKDVTTKNATANGVKKTIQKLQSLSTAWVKIEGLNEKCRQLVATPYGLLAATNGGLYFVTNHRANLIVKNRYINSISWMPFGGKYFVGAGDGYFSVRYSDGKWLAETPDREFVNPVYSVVQKSGKTLWLGCDNTVLKAEQGEKMQYTSYAARKDYPERYSVDLINDTVFLFTESGVSFYDVNADKFRVYGVTTPESREISDFQTPLSNNRIFRKAGNWYTVSHDNKISTGELSVLKIFDDVVSVYVENGNLWVIAGNNKLYCINRRISSGARSSALLFVRSIYNEKGTAFNLGDVKFDRGDNVINFSIISPEYLKSGTTEYQYTISKVMQGWSPWDNRTRYSKAITRPGDYVLKVRARDLFGNVSKEQSVNFTIRAPFTKTLAFYLLSGLLTLGIVIAIIRFREGRLHHANKILEQKVKERTAEIEAQKAEITASIEYASRIQMAMLPFKENFNSLFSDNFIMFKPRDIVSGDFYWIGENDKSYFFTVADCTGHGVPGAFMSTLGISTLHEIVSNNKKIKANAVLNILRNKIMYALHQTGRVGEAADGMDIAFCVLDKERKVLEYAGAYNPLIIFQNGELKEYKADRMPIGIHYGDPAPFTNYEIRVTKGDTLYIFSDGFCDQFGGPEGAKYKKANLKKLLAQIYYRPMSEQKEILEKELSDWRGEGSQIDDITILGIRI
jgi:serine phosphatase RsbU (regulator of sigma subunit)